MCSCVSLYAAIIVWQSETYLAAPRVFKLYLSYLVHTTQTIILAI